MTSSTTSSDRVVAVGRIHVFLDEKLGEGASGAVYKGKLDSVQEIAVKRMFNDNWALAEKNLLTIEHENLVRFLAIEETQELVYIAMELCVGTLEQLISQDFDKTKHGSMEEVLLQATDGLQHLHSNDIIHRDIKPDNILISNAVGPTNKPLVKLADFGLCKTKPEGASCFSKTESFIGSRGYAAPEMSVNQLAQCNFKADVFSLGCVFGYALTKGSHPFGQPDLRSHNIVSDGYQINWPEKQLIGHTPLREMVLQMIDKNPALRPELHSVIDCLSAAIKRKSMAFALPLPLTVTAGNLYGPQFGMFLRRFPNN